MKNSLKNCTTILASSQNVIEFDQANASGCRIIDVRSAAEFADGAMPGAINIPLFNEQERGLIGTIYRHGGRTQAVQQGFDFVLQRLDELLAAFTPYKNEQLAVCCARGGMRSLSVVNLLSQAGYSAKQIHGGYKKYRHITLSLLEQFRPRLIVIHGLTGTGKTRLLHRLTEAIDLEAMAGHRSSLFGGLTCQVSTQQTFESRLAERIASLGVEPYFIEGESRKIGRVFIPKALAAAMKEAILVKIHCRLETRIARIIEDYPIDDERTLLEIEAILKTLTQKMGHQQVEKMCRLLHHGDISELVHILLMDYYDKRYAASMRDYRFALEIPADDLDAAAQILVNFRESKIA
jgi:tRNA 2-selenouridine synthase